MKIACLGLVLLASVACAAAADNRRLLQDGFNPLDSLVNKTNKFEKIGKDAPKRKPHHCTLPTHITAHCTFALDIQVDTEHSDP